MIILPDVYKHEHETFLVPFCGRPLNVMLGTAALARKTGTLILPRVSQPAARGFGFTSAFGGVLDERPTSGDDTLHANYRVTAQVFRQLERVMDSEIVYCQRGPARAAAPGLSSPCGRGGTTSSAQQ